MQTKHLFFFYKKSVNLASEIILSCVLSLIVYFLYTFLQAPIIEQLHLNRAEFSIDYSANNTNGASGTNNSVLGIGSHPIQIKIKTYDYRARVFDMYFKENDSPLYGYGESFTAACDKYGAPHDCTLLLAIARVETNLCKTSGSLSQHNCWGYGGSGENRIIYKNFDQAVHDITRRLMAGYTKKFFLDPEFGELTYCGPHCYKWGDYVKAEQGRIQSYARRNGYTL